MDIVSREELKEKLDRGDDFKLVMTLAEWAYNMSHIPGSLNITSMTVAKELLQPDDEIVVYCSDRNCIASQAAYKYLTENGFSNLRRYEGGLSDWEQAGFKLEGEAHAAGA